MQVADDEVRPLSSAFTCHGPNLPNFITHLPSTELSRPLNPPASSELCALRSLAVSPMDFTLSPILSAGLPEPACTHLSTSGFCDCSSMFFLTISCHQASHASALALPTCSILTASCILNRSIKHYLLFSTS